MNKNKNIFLNGLIDLAQSRLGSKIVYKTDEFFAPAKRIINPWPPVFKEGVFDKHGKWMDGWETRRKRNKGHDYLILKLGKPGKIHKVDIDTSYFNGNQPSKVSLDACYSKNKLPNKNSKWINILKKKSTKPNSHHFFNINFPNCNTTQPTPTATASTHSSRIVVSAWNSGWITLYLH